MKPRYLVESNRPKYISTLDIQGPGALQLIDGGHRRPSLVCWIGEIGAYRHSSFCTSAFCSTSKDKWTRGLCFVEARSLSFGWFCRWSRTSLFTFAV